MEEWRSVVGWDGFYEVSNCGAVRGLKRGRQLRAVIKRGTGYAVVTLHRPGETKPTQVGIHRLVLDAFVGRRADMQACHGNGDKADNRIENLRWGSAADNAADRTVHGTQLVGGRNPHAKLTEEDVREILASVETQQTLADRFGVTQVCISLIRRGKNWRHLSAPESMGEHA
jgi:hypothetical protein